MREAPVIGTVVVSYKRPELLRKTLTSYLETVSVPYQLLVVDNASGPENRAVIEELDVDALYLEENRFPGYATNTGWDVMASHYKPSYLHRSDGDVEYLPGWCEEVMRRFRKNKNLGQFGLRTVEEEGPAPNCGGNCVVTPRVFEQVRWQEEGWVRGGHTEDYFFSVAIEAAGFARERALEPCIVHLGDGTPETDPYYAETWKVRGHGGY